MSRQAFTVRGTVILPTTFAVRSPSFYTSTRYLVTDKGELKQIEILDDAIFRGVFNGQMLVGLRSDWTVGGETFVQGSLIAADFEKFLQGEPELARGL